MSGSPTPSSRVSGLSADKRAFSFSKPSAAAVRNAGPVFWFKPVRHLGSAALHVFCTLARVLSAQAIPVPAPQAR